MCRSSHYKLMNYFVLLVIIDFFNTFNGNASHIETSPLTWKANHLIDFDIMRNIKRRLFSRCACLTNSSFQIMSVLLIVETCCHILLTVSSIAHKKLESNVSESNFASKNVSCLLSTKKISSYRVSCLENPQTLVRRYFSFSYLQK